MYRLDVENKQGARLQLSQNESNYQVLKVDGLLPPKANIHTTTIANMDGERFKSSNLQVRNLVLTLKIKGDIEKNRNELYRFCSVGEECKVYFKTSSRDVYAEGYVEVVEGDVFTNNETIQISIICTNPYFHNMHTIYSDLSKLFANFSFPFAIDKTGIEFSSIDVDKETEVINYGDVKTGVLITIKSNLDGITNPIIYNVITGEFFKINTTLNDGEIITINTNRSKFKITKKVGVDETNLMASVESGSTWFQLNVGVNRFTYSADSNSELLEVSFEYHNLFKGV